MATLGGIDSATDVPTRTEQRIAGPYAALSSWRRYFHRSATFGGGWSNASDWGLNAPGTLYATANPPFTATFFWHGTALVLNGWTMQWLFRCQKYTTGSYNATFRLNWVNSSTSGGGQIFVDGRTEQASTVVMFDQALSQTIVTAPPVDRQLFFSVNPSTTTSGTSTVICELYYRYV